MGSSLEDLLAEGVISEILGRVKTGKEAEVYAVRYGEQVVAAKVYKDRAQRSFKSNAAYKEGRRVQNSRSQRAMDRGSNFGKAEAEEAWKTEEANALYRLHDAGVRVPKPVMYIEGVLLMELVTAVDGQVAPRLIDVNLSPAEANAAYKDMLSQLVRMLTCDLIHGDLSPYNVLWAANGPTIIDFPQILAAAQNRNAESFFMRDARNILSYFAEIDPSLRRRGSDASEIWQAYMRRELTPDFMPMGQGVQAERRPFQQDGRNRPAQQHGQGPNPGQQRNRDFPPQGQRGGNGRRPHPPTRSQQENRGHAAPAPAARAPQVMQSAAPPRSRGRRGSDVIVMVRRPLNSSSPREEAAPVASSADMPNAASAPRPKAPFGRRPR